MIYANSMLTNLTRLSLENHDDNLSVNVYDRNFHSFVAATFDKLSTDDLDYKKMINSLNMPESTSNPENLFKLQAFLGEYSNYVSLVSTLARKGVSTIETLEKS
ncbi:type III secretion system protein [Salmonella enterica subsp. enterica]|nr:type III secretion system protein [Salmonella enterica subsp. enterica]MIY24066.1 type III secretion system protein [Salmonella enterica subsp. enterica]